MKVSELKAELRKLPKSMDDRPVLCQKDEEGNGFMHLYSVEKLSGVCVVIIPCHEEFESPEEAAETNDSEIEIIEPLEKVVVNA